MKLWIDCEYNDFLGPLISMALVDENGVEWYKAVPCENPSPWVTKHVMPIINIEPCSLNEMRNSLWTHLSKYDKIHIIADWPEDIVHFCQLLVFAPGKSINIPPLSMEVVSVQSYSELPHNALADAVAIRKAMLINI